MDKSTDQTQGGSFWHGVLGLFLGGVIGFGAGFWTLDEHILMAAGIGAGIGFLLGLFTGEWAIEHLKDIVVKWV